MSFQPSRSARLEARITPDALEAVRRAAELQGRSVSDFVVAAAQDAARRAIEDNQLIRLSLADQQQFADLLLSPPPVSAALERAKHAHKRLIVRSE